MLSLACAVFFLPANKNKKKQRVGEGSRRIIVVRGKRLVVVIDVESGEASRGGGPRKHGHGFHVEAVGGIGRGVGGHR